MWPRLFLYRTIIGRCWPGVLRLPSSEVSWFWGCGMRKFLKKLLFQRNLCYHAFHETIWLQKRELVRVKLVEKAPQKRFLTAVAKPAA